MSHIFLLQSTRQWCTDMYQTISRFQLIYESVLGFTTCQEKNIISLVNLQMVPHWNSFLWSSIFPQEPQNVHPQLLV